MAMQPSLFLVRRRELIERTRSGPTLAQLRTQAKEALRAEEGPDLGPLSHEERNKILFGL